MPLALLKKTADGQPGQDRLDSLWNETFKKRIRAAILGHNFDGDGTFEDTIRRLVDCRAAGFSDGSEADDITSHDVEGDGNQRLFDYLDKYGVGKKNDSQARLHLPVIAVGIPRIFAG